MKILHCVEHFAPHKGGMAEVVGQLSLGLFKSGHEIHIACTEHPDRDSSPQNGLIVHSFNIRGNLEQGIISSKEEIDRYRSFVTKGNFDIVTCFAATQWSTDLLLEILPTIPSKKVFVPTGFTGMEESRPYFQSMKVWLSLFDHIVFLSSNYYDINFTRRLGLNHWSIIPNGCSLSEFSVPKDVQFYKKLHINPKNKLLLHIGSHTTMKGHDELYAIFRLAKLRKATLLIIGNFLDNPRFKFFDGIKTLVKYFLGYKMGCSLLCKIAHDRIFGFLFRFLVGLDIRVVQLPREETVQAYLHADLFLFPSNIECSPIVLFESIASGTYFISSRAGNTEEILSWFGGGGQLFPGNPQADGKVFVDISESATLLRTVIQNLSTFESEIERAREIWRTSYTWEAITTKYEKLYSRLMSNV